MVFFSLGNKFDLDNELTGRSLMQSRESSSKSQNFIRNINPLQWKSNSVNMGELLVSRLVSGLYLNTGPVFTSWHE